MLTSVSSVPELPSLNRVKRDPIHGGVVLMGMLDGSTVIAQRGTWPSDQ